MTGMTMLTTAHTSAAIANGSTRALTPAARAAGTARAGGLGFGPDGHRAGVVGVPGVGIFGRLRSGHPGNTTDTASRIGVPSVGCARMPTATIPITGDPAADDLLVTDPLALVIGMLLDQQVPMEWAFRGPATLRDRLGSSRLRGDRGDAARRPRSGVQGEARAPPLPGVDGEAHARAVRRTIVERVRRRRREDLEGREGPAGAVRPHPRAPRLRRREGEDLPRHPRQATEGRAEGLGGVRGTVLRRQAALGRRHRLTREPPARARVEAGPEGRRRSRSPSSADRVQTLEGSSTARRFRRPRRPRRSRGPTPRARNSTTPDQDQRDHEDEQHRADPRLVSTAPARAPRALRSPARAPRLCAPTNSSNAFGWYPRSPALLRAPAIARRRRTRRRLRRRRRSDEVRDQRDDDPDHARA